MSKSLLAIQDAARIESVQTAVRTKLLPWFRVNQRRLPWRTRRTPYRVWVSEMMLQQTRVETAVAYYRRWMERFPGVRAVAEAPRQDVLKAWEGLGYYARAHHAHAAAQRIVTEHGGRFPRTLDALRALPGIGPYTAAAIGSLAMGLPAAVVDGNVMRVVSRVYGLTEDVRRVEARRQLDAWAAEHIRAGPPGEVNEAFMELGATICIPRSPRCGECPLRWVCRATRMGSPEALPVKGPAKAVPHIHVGAGVVVNRRGALLIAQRPEHKMLGGLWEFPGGRRELEESMPECVARELNEELGLSVRVGPPLVVVRHAFSHFTMELHAFWARIERGRPQTRECAAYAWVRTDQLDEFPMPKADQRIRGLVQTTEIPVF